MKTRFASGLAHSRDLMRVPQHPRVPVLSTEEQPRRWILRSSQTEQTLQSSWVPVPSPVELLHGNTLLSWIKPPALPGTTPRQGREARFGP